MGVSNSPQSPLLYCKVRSISVSIPMGLVSFSVLVPHRNQVLPHEECFCLPIQLRELGSL